jgi:hypothetical protein
MVSEFVLTAEPVEAVLLPVLEALANSPQPLVSWDIRPSNIADDNWRDLHVGALFFATRDAAVSLLQQVEAYVANQGDQRLSLRVSLPATFSEKIITVRKCAQDFISEQHDPSPDRLANTFCRGCVDNTDQDLLLRLVERDGRVLRIRESTILPGSAFRGGPLQQVDAARSAEEGESEVITRPSVDWPEGISHRIQNLFMLNLDLGAELGTWLADAQQPVDGNNQDE